MNMNQSSDLYSPSAAAILSALTWNLSSISMYRWSSSSYSLILSFFMVNFTRLDISNFEVFRAPLLPHAD
jgi:hypothetical protein